MENLLKQLSRLGFTPQQAKLYLAGLQLGDCLMANLASKAGVKRSSAYYAIEELQRRGFFTLKKIGKRTYYAVASPEKLLQLTEERLRLVKNLLPHLKKVGEK